MPIRVLAAEVALKIAAGEVITRPTDAVKELVENAVDASVGGSDLPVGPASPRVEVEIRGGGLSLIRVVDHGCGIPAAEVALAFQRHATSKLASADDLFAVRTLGFRGEALASIAAVSEVTIYTRTADTELGTLLSLDAGRLVDESQRAGPVGTSVTVRGLFSNVPARLRFLRSAAGEAGQAAHVLAQYAIAYPEIAFSLLNEGRTVLQTPGSGRLDDALIRVHGTALFEKLLPVSAESGRVKLSGYVAEPGTHRSTRTSISIFVNRRWVQSRPLTYAVEEAYQPSLPDGRHPVAALWLELPPSEVDVNVHPTKAEVRFVDERALYSVVRRAVREALLRSAPVPAVGAALAPALGGSAPAGWQVAAESSPVAGAPAPDAAEPGAAAASGEARAPAPVGLPILHPLGQVQKTYIVAEGPDGVYFVDQHTAHERIRYEEVRAQRESGEVAAQALLEPLVVELSPRQWELLGEGAPTVRSLGFSFEPFGERSCLVRAVPVILRGEGLGEALRDVVDSLALEGPAPGIDGPSAVLACHSAVRAGDSLTPEEIRALLGRLEGMDVWRYCPHGRPIVMRLDAAQLARDFRRT